MTSDNRSATTRKHSKKRDAVFNAIRHSKEHPSAEMIHASLKPDYPSLSLGTVYRNLSLFLEEGDIVCIGNVNGQDRYDADTADHAHFICLACASVTDIVLDKDISALYHQVESNTGGLVESHELIFRGHCPACRKKST